MWWNYHLSTDLWKFDVFSYFTPEFICTGRKSHQSVKSGKRKGTSTRHELIHKEVKSYLCDKCGKTFAWRCHLKKHELIHTGEKRHKCTKCGKRFTQRSHLTAHELTHTRDKPHQCTECGKRFTHRSNLTVHKSTHTRETLH